MLVTDSKDKSYTDPPPLEDLPPAYSDDQPPVQDAPGYSAGPSSSTTTASFVPAPSIHPCNHLLLSERDSTIGGQYLLDVGLPTPPLAATMPSFKQLGNANLRFEIRDGGIRPEIWLAALREKAPPETRARVVAKIRDGSVKIVLHTPHPTMPRPRISVSVEIRDGDATVAVPRSFTGQFTINKRYGSLSLSPGIQSRTQILYSASGTQLYSVGGYNLQGPDQADELRIDKRDGSLSILYDDEIRK